MSVIVPARNEEACLGLCLESLVSQSGVDFEIIVVDDSSTDRTAEIARSFANRAIANSTGVDARGYTRSAGLVSMRVVSAPPLPENWIGKNHATAVGAREGRGKWLLFTDADTVHKPGSLARSVAEAERHGVALLSYSPQQEVHGFWEQAVMPVVFAELAATYPPKKVSDPASPIAAANGQYLMIRRDVYDAVGRYEKIANEILEDVAMARLVKSSGRKILFRYGGDAVSTRMYRSWPQLKEGWTKNMVLLFPKLTALAVRRFVEFGVIVGGTAVGFVAALLHSSIIAGCAFAVALVFAARAFMRFRRAHFPVLASALSMLGLPVFASLLLRSKAAFGKRSVTWKGREYRPGASSCNEQLRRAVPDDRMV